MDEILDLLHGCSSDLSVWPDISSQEVQDAIRAHVHGDRGPMKELERRHRMKEKEGS